MRRGEQISATPTSHRQGLAGRGYGGVGQSIQPLGDFFNFLEKIAILMPFGSHFACFQSHFKNKIFEI